MRLRQKSLLIIFLTLAGLMVLLYITSRIILLNSYAQLEEQELRQNVDRAKDALQADLSAINATAGDYAGWDESYSFIENGNRQYIQKNLADSAFANLKVNLMLFVHASGRIVYAKAVDPRTGTAQLFPQSFLKRMTPDNPLLHHKNPLSAISGIVVLPEGSLLVGSRPIVNSEFKGPIRGSLIVGRFLDNNAVQRLEKTTHLSILMLPMEEALNSPSLGQAARFLSRSKVPFYQHPLGNGRIAGGTAIKDIYGIPALFLQVDTPRGIYNEGQATLRYLVISWMVLGLVFAILVGLLLDRLVISRLGRLSRSVAEIGVGSNFAGRVSAEGNDEISQLSISINGMLGALQQAQEALEKSALEADTANKELQTFSYSVSHDLRAPLRSISGYSKIIQEDCPGLDAADLQYLIRIDGLCRRMEGIIDSLLQFSSAGRGGLAITEVSLSDMAGTTVDELREGDRGREVEVLIAAGITAVGDPQLLTVVMQNLIGNAWKYTKRNTNARIEFGVTETPRGRTFFVRDNGAGFDMSYADQLFQPFTRLHSDREYEGSGIGLATAKRIIQRHGGLIWGNGEVGKGATFYFTLHS